MDAERAVLYLGGDSHGLPTFIYPIWGAEYTVLTTYAYSI
jgi:hypothetical protein